MRHIPAVRTMSCCAPRTSARLTRMGMSRRSSTFRWPLAEESMWQSAAPAGAESRRCSTCLARLDMPTRGRILFEDRPLADGVDLDRFRAAEIGFVFQSFHLMPTLTAAENVQVPMFEGSLSRSQRAARAKELLSLVGLGHREDHLPSQMSVGERQRTAIARRWPMTPGYCWPMNPQAIWTLGQALRFWTCSINCTGNAK